MKQLLILIFALFSLNNLSYAAMLGDCTDDNAINITDVVCTINLILNPVENTPALCSDGGDNDSDGNADCADSDCQGFAAICPTSCDVDDDCGPGQSCDFSTSMCI